MALALVALVILAGIAADSEQTSASHAGGMDAGSIDLNVSGNDADTLGPTNSCRVANPGDSITIDVTALNIPITTRMIAWAYHLGYDENVFTVSDVNPGGFSTFISALPGSNAFSAGEPPPDTDGDYSGAAADIGDPEPGDPNVNSSAEFGSGVLERLVLDISAGAAAGQYTLTLSDMAHVDLQSQAYPPDVINSATIAIGQSCPTVFGDVDCDTAVNSVDALKVLRHGAGLSVSQTEPCVNLGDPLPNTELQGDVDCSNSVNSVDALKLLRHAAGLSVSQNEPPPCPDIGS